MIHGKRKLIICGGTPNTDKEISELFADVIQTESHDFAETTSILSKTPSIALITPNELKKAETDLANLLKEAEKSRSIICALSENSISDDEIHDWSHKGIHHALNRAAPLFKEGLKSIVQTTMDADKQSLEITQRDGEIKNLRQSLQLANQTAFAALNTLAETGGILNAIIDLFSADDKDTLAKICISSLKEIDLKSHIWLYNEKGIEHFGAEAPSKAEESIILKTRDKRIFSSGQVAIFHARLTSIFISNMPIDDPDRTGRLRDVISYLTQAASARVKSIALEETIKKQSKSTIDLILLTRTISQDTHKHTMEIINRLIVDLEVAVTKIAETDEQEKYFEGIITKCATDMETLYRNNCLVEQHYVNLAEGFRKALTFVDKT